MFLSKDKPTLDPVLSPSCCGAFPAFSAGCDSPEGHGPNRASEYCGGAAPLCACRPAEDCAEQAAANQAAARSKPPHNAGFFAALVFIPGSHLIHSPQNRGAARQWVAMNAVVAAASASCATAIRFFHPVEPPMAFSGTTTVSPGSIGVDCTPPIHNSPP